MEKLGTLINLLRVPQWIKNSFVFAAILFGGRLQDISRLENVFAAFLLFCMASSAIYIFNDIIDRETDKEHPEKSKRPIASGSIPVWQAFILSGILALFSVAVSLFISKGFLAALVGYMLFNCLYSLALKHVVIIDIFMISFGFVLRLLAGGYAADLPISSWAILCTVFISLFLGFAKRRHEILLLKDNSTEHRKVLSEYSVEFLDRMIGIVTACTIMSYMLYTVETAPQLIFTSVFVLYGIFRYLYLVYQRGEGGNPTMIVLSDIPLMLGVLLWAVVSGIIIHS